MSTLLDPEELRALVREVLREALPSTVAALTDAADPRSHVPADSPPVESVVIRSDADLEAFVQRLLRLVDDPERGRDLRAGRIRFRLGSAEGESAPQLSTPPAGAVIRVERGAVTERHVREAARAGASIVMSRSAVLTPLALDRARAMGVSVEKERP
ncbi:MAG TPA: hypothetical protein VMI11_10955 [Actinomycetes bacterium]|nr:hypothetical protein [Actinomycetes bacterium]